MTCKTAKGAMRKILLGDGRTGDISKAFEQQQEKNRKKIAKMSTLL